ncbi:AmmeMemoRadiSam system radical SAM enzyme [Patescibacteria group bacterium]|nr:AmmeMemoRadiSam system radical SAM enzyme [Patescibacteria group bacterium]
MKEALLYQKLANDEVRCNLCNHFCVLKDSELGICGCRKNVKGILMSLSYGQLITESLDPIEKKPIFNFLPGTSSYSIATVGCNLRCDNCQNWQISQFTKDHDSPFPGYETSSQEVIERAQESGAQSISYTYTEPTIFMEFALDCMKLAHDKNLKNIWVSNGYMSRACLELILPYLDAINIDLKFFDNNNYLKYCGCKLQPILDNLKYLHQHQVHLEITTLLIPNHTDTGNQLTSMAEFIAQKLSVNVPWHLSRFSPDISYKMPDTKATPMSLIDQAYKIGQSKGLNFIYVGNVADDERENTYCPRCGFLAIKRQDYQTEIFADNGLCKNCKYEIY